MNRGVYLTQILGSVGALLWLLVDGEGTAGRYGLSLVMIAVLALLAYVATKRSDAA